MSLRAMFEEEEEKLFEPPALFATSDFFGGPKNNYSSIFEPEFLGGHHYIGGPIEEGENYQNLKSSGI